MVQHARSSCYLGGSRSIASSFSRNTAFGDKSVHKGREQTADPISLPEDR
jgi:hypothetical protein